MHESRGDDAKNRSGMGAPDAETPLRVSTVTSTADLEAHAANWEALAADAIEPNVFHEPWVLLPALRAFGGGEDFVHTLIWRGETLLGFVPFVRERPLPGAPFARLRVWEHDQSALSLPLFHRVHARPALSAMIDWARRERYAAQLSFPSYAGDGAFSHALTDVVEAGLITTTITEEHTRPFFRPRASAEDYLSAALGSSTRRTLRKQEKKLGEVGPIRHEIARKPEDVARWVDEFLALEARGWKGARGTAFASSDAGATFFREVARGGAERHRFEGSTLYLGDRAVAMRCALRSGVGGFGYKSAYDEELSKLSPGVHLEIRAIEAMHADPTLEWLDSCAVSTSALYNRVFLDRRTVRSLLVGTGGVLGDAATALYPAARFLKRMLKRKI